MSRITRREAVRIKRKDLFRRGLLNKKRWARVITFPMLLEKPLIGWLK